MPGDPAYSLLSPRFWRGELDLRPLCFMRLAFGAMLFGATLYQGPTLFILDSDSGVAPRPAFLGTLVGDNRFSVYDLAGPSWVLVTLYVLTLVAIACFTVGYRARWSVVATFFLYCGLSERNLLACMAGDAIVRPMLFWLMFTPLGARYSVDAWLRRRAGEAAVTHGHAFPIRLVQLQLCWVYFGAVLCKWPGKAWHDGTALRTVLGLTHFSTSPLAHFFFDQRWFVHLGTHATMSIEAAFLPLALVPPGRPSRGPFSRWPRFLFQPTYRALALASGASLHLGIALLMDVSNFSYAMLSTYFVLFEPSWIAALVAPWTSDAFPAPRFPETDSASRLDAERNESALTRGCRALLYLALGALMGGAIWCSLPNATHLGRLSLSPEHMPTAFRDLLRELEIDNRWVMFAPTPTPVDIYLTGRGNLTDETPVDVLYDAPLGGKPLLASWAARGNLAHYLGELLMQADNSPWSLEFGRFLCRRWNNHLEPGQKQLKAFKLYRNERKVPGFDEPWEDWREIEIWDHHCF